VSSWGTFFTISSWRCQLRKHSHDLGFEQSNLLLPGAMRAAYEVSIFCLKHIALTHLVSLPNSGMKLHLFESTVECGAHGFDALARVCQ
jgi:hypothetical protein